MILYIYKYVYIGYLSIYTYKSKIGQRVVLNLGLSSFFSKTVARRLSRQLPAQS